MLFQGLKPRSGRMPAAIDLRCCDTLAMLRSVSEARLIIADPPWRYARDAGGANPEENGIYGGLSELEIASHLDASFAAAGPSARLAVWYTFPKDAEWAAAGNAGPRWGPRTSGGAWTKHPHFGVGYHWRGSVEPVALFTKGSTGRPRENLLNGYVSAPEEHSAKPIPWMRQWIRAWTDPDDLVVDLYAGLGSVAVACALEGRRYVGAELDEERHRRATLNVAEALS